mmetsp:Transcript_2423/g.3718  ORF Transcript_2423/g.3718 Transcript_2423/m.3718 type:complete len:114 (-) Transcript_2423:166-507(-)
MEVNASMGSTQQPEVPEVMVRQENAERRRSGLPGLDINAPITGEEYASVFYKRSNARYGGKQPDRVTGPQHGLSNQFTAHLANAGMYRNQSLSTCVEPPRYMDGNTDWMMKNV